MTPVHLINSLPYKVIEMSSPILTFEKFSPKIQLSGVKPQAF